MKQYLVLGLILFVFLGCNRKSDFNLADDFFKQKKYEQAIIVYQRLLKNNPQSDLINKKMGLSYYEISLYKEACLFIEKSLISNKFQPELKKIYAKALFNAKEYYKSIGIFYELIEENNDKTFLIDISLAYLNIRDLKNGLAKYNEWILEVSDKDKRKDLRKQISEILKTYNIDFGCNEKSEFYKTVYEETKTLEDLINYYNSIVCLNNFTLSESLLLILIEKTKNVKYFNDLALLYIKNSNLEKADDYVFKSEEINMNQIDTIYIRGLLFYNNQKFDSALSYFNIFIEKGGNTENLDFLRGECFYQLKEFGKSIELLEKYYTVNPKNLEALIRLRDNYVALKNEQKVIDLDYEIKWFYKK